MSSDELSLFSYEILGLVGPGGAGPHDLRGMVRRGRILDWAGESQYYVEPKRLAALGYLSARKEPGKTRDRTVYALTEKGRQALAEYAGTPAAITPVKSEALLHEAGRTASELPHRAKYLLLVVAFLHRLLDLHEQLVDEVEREFATPA